jgi:hypothetical protein
LRDAGSDATESEGQTMTMSIEALVLSLHISLFLGLWWLAIGREWISNIIFDFEQRNEQKK